MYRFFLNYLSTLVSLLIKCQAVICRISFYLLSPSENNMSTNKWRLQTPHGLIRSIVPPLNKNFNVSKRGIKNINKEKEHFLKIRKILCEISDVKDFRNQYSSFSSVAGCKKF